MVVSYLRIPDPGDAAVPEVYRRNRAMDAGQVLAVIREQGGRAVAIEADLADPETPRRLFDAAEAAFGPVDILINNATGWVADTFSPTPAGRFGHQQVRVSAETIDRQFAVDARGSALLIGEFARRHAARGATWGRILDPSAGRLSERGHGRRKRARKLHTMPAAFVECRRHGNVVHPPVTDTGWVTEEVRRLVNEHPELIHIATPGEVARVIAYLVSDDARLISGNRVHLR